MVPLAIPEQVPLLYLPNQVLLPGGFLKIRIEGEQNKSLMRSQLQIINHEERKAIIGVIPQSEEEQSFNDDTVGTVAIVFQVMSTSWPKPCYSAIIFGLYRFKLQQIVELEPYPTATINLHYDNFKGNEEVELLLEDLKKACSPLWQSIDVFFPSSKKFKKVLPPTYVVDVCASFVTSTFAEKLDILRTLDFSERLKKTSALVAKHIEGLDIEPDPFVKSITGAKPIKIASVRIKTAGRLNHRRIIQADLEENDENEELLKKLKNANLPDYANKIAMHELRRLKHMSTYSPEHGVIRNYLELVADLPWSVTSNEILDIRNAKKDLDADHYAMDKLKKRVLEFLAVRQLKNNLKGPILCFVGAPGVGKTSIGKSIAKTLGRAFHRISLGGVNNQSDIRGHRRTYVGALPGRIIQGLHSAGTKNPVFLLDEIDKMSVSNSGDPAAALLEVLDPEQNSHFTDHYLNMPFDLSQVMFIATANRTSTIPPALLDRMEVIHVPGYTEEEKFHIVEKHLLPKQLDQHGLNENYINITEDSIKHLINGYTKEAGVRTLERKLAAVCRAVAVQVAEGDLFDENPANSSKLSLPITVTLESLHQILGPPTYDGDSLWGRVGVPGVAVGLACNSAGGSVMLVEASKLRGGSGELVLTGHLGTVMKESAKLALNWVRSVALQYGLQSGGVDLMTDTDVHIHFPAGAIGKEGPSAGVTIATALISLFTGIPVASDIALTGEITLQGVVLPVGGIKDKILAAHQAGLRRVLIPNKSKKDLVNISKAILSSMEVVLVSRMDEVLLAAFNGQLIPKCGISSLSSKL